MKPTLRTTKRVLLLSGILLALAGTAPGLLAEELAFRRGDANGDGSIDVSDAVASLKYLFLGGTTPGCAKAVDANDDGRLDISDPLFALAFLFSGGTAIPAPGVACGSDPTADDLDCLAYSHCPGTPILGQSVFERRGQGPANPAIRGATPGAVEDASPGAAVPPSPAPAQGNGQAVAPERLVEESDIYKLDGTNLFVLNRYRGLQIIDLSDFDHPHLIGRAPIYGYPRDMYVRGNRAYVIVSDYYSFWRDPVAEADVMPWGFYGSQVRIVDLADVRNPSVVGEINLDGEVTDTRIVGEVMYVVSQRYPWYFRYGSSDNLDQTEVLSIDIHDPANIAVVDKAAFPRNGWAQHVNVTSDRIYLASSGYSGGSTTETWIRVIDISDPAGQIALRGETRLIGQVRDRWSLDEYQDVLRVATSDSWGNGNVYLTTFSVSDPDHPSRLGGYVLNVAETITAARFSGDRGYLVTYRNIDPLFTFDLSNPAKPRLEGELKMTGWLDFIVPVGTDRLAALGHEDTTVDGVRQIRLAVSLIDVAAAGQPSLLSRVTLDGLWGWVPSSADDFAKVFRVLPEDGLILFPYQAWDPKTYTSVGGVQLIDLSASSLTRRGLIQNAGWVERGVPDGKDTVLTIGSDVFQVLDIQDRDHPLLRGRLELARNVQDFNLLPGDSSVQLAGDWNQGSTSLVVTPIADPDTPEPTASLLLPAPYGRMFVNGSLSYVASVKTTYDDQGVYTGQTTEIQVVDLGDPSHPKVRGSVSLPEPVWLGYHGWFWGSGDEVVQVNGSTLAFHRFQWWWWRGCLDCPVAAGAAGADVGGDPGLPAQKIYLVDLKDPDAPAVASTVEIDDQSWAWGLRASGTTLYLSSYQSMQDPKDLNWVTRYYLNRVEVSDPAHPVTLPSVNIPGMFLDASPDGQYLYTLENFWDSVLQTSRTILYDLALLDGKAYLQSQVELPGYVGSVQIEGSAAFASSNFYEVRILADKSQQWVNHSLLLTVDLADPSAIRLAGQTEVPYDYAYLQKVEDGRAFLGAYAGIFTYQVKDLANPVFEKFFRTQGWSQDILVRDERAFVPSGYYGVQILDLGTSANP